MSASVKKKLQLGHQWLQNGELDEAERCFRAVVDREPSNARALHMLGLIAHRRGDHGAAITALEAAARAAPENAEIHSHLAEILRTSGDPRRAADFARVAVRIRPGWAPAQNNLGLALQDSGDLDQAAEAFEAAIAADGGHAKAWYNLGNLQRRLLCFEEAEASLRQALKLRPGYTKAWNALGVVLGDLGRIEEALRALRKALEIAPNYPQAHYNLGNLLLRLDRPSEALDCFDRCLSLDPSSVKALMAKGSLLVRSDGRYDEGLRILHELERRAPADPRIQLALGEASFKRFDFAAAAAAYANALELEPDLPEAKANLTLCRAEICDWRARSQEIEDLRELITTQLAAGRPSPLSAHGSVFFPLSPGERLAIARRTAEEAAQRVAPAAAELAFAHRPRRNGRLRIGYLSSDFRDNALAHLTVRLYGLHDRDRFEVHCYSMGPDDRSFYRREIEDTSDHFVDLRGVADAKAAQRIYEDEIDILVDLVGFAGGARPGIPALKPAPVQAIWLYPGSMGGLFHDYLIGDPVATPRTDCEEYGERLVMLPHCYQITDHLQPVPQRPPGREDFGLPADGFVFCSFNSPAKIAPEIFDVWMRLLTATPGSVLWLLHLSVAARQNLLREAEQRGVDPERLVFASHVPRSEHLTRLTLADLALDTDVCSGHTTTSDALWAGVPVVACPGDTFPSRVSASLLSAAGAPELVTEDLGAYEGLALRLAQNPVELAALRERLAANRRTASLFDTPRFVHHLESAFGQMWELREEASQDPIQVAPGG